MIGFPRLFAFGVTALLLLAGPAQADTPADTQATKYTLRYKFQPGERIRWKVVHRSRVRTTVSDSTQVAETVSQSVKLWRVTTAKPDGSAVFAHMVQSVDMRQKLTGRQEVRYNSRTDKTVPKGFQTVAKSIGVPLSIVTIDPRGKVLDRQRRVKQTAVSQDGQITIPLPEEPIPVGHTWSLPYDITVQLTSGGIKKVKTRQAFTLKSVKTGVATIRVVTQVLTPINDPAIEAQIIQRESTGTVRFDIDAGRIVSQQMDVDKRVIGFRGEASSLHYLTRFTEELLTDRSESGNTSPLSASATGTAKKKRR